MKKPILKKDKTEVLKPKNFISREIDPSRETDGGKRKMFMGEYHHAIDDKNRLIIPSSLRQQERPKVTAIGKLLMQDFDFTHMAIVDWVDNFLLYDDNKGVYRILRKDEVNGSSPGKDRDDTIPSFSWISLSGKGQNLTQNELASHLLGFTGIDNQGLAGLELYYEEELRGKRGHFLIREDALGYEIPLTRRVTQGLDPGKDIVLTIDNMMQSMVEKERSLRS